MLEAAGWYRVPWTVNDSHVEGRWVLSFDDADGVAMAGPSHSVAPSGHQRSVVLHRGGHCDGPVFSINVTTPEPVNARAAMAAIRAQVADDHADMTRPCRHMGFTVVFDSVTDAARIDPAHRRDGSDWTVICTKCGLVEAVTGPRRHADRAAANHRSTGRTFTGASPRPVYLDPDAIDGGRLDAFLIDRAEHDAHTDIVGPEE
jgi:hypothetical protein